MCAVKSVLEFCLLGLCVVVITLLACWGWWELHHWWQTRRQRKYLTARPWPDEEKE